MTYLIKGMPHKVGTVCYFFADNAVRIGIVHEIIIRSTAKGETCEYKVRQTPFNFDNFYESDTKPKSYFYVTLERIALDMEKMSQILQALYEEAVKAKKEDMFNVDQD